MQTCDVNVLTIRQRTAARCVLDSHDLEAAKGSMPQLGSILQMDLNQAYNRTTQRWSMTNVVIDEYTSVFVCPSAYALLLGATSSLFRRAADLIKQNKANSATTVPQWKTMTTKEQLNHVSHDRSMLKSYVATLLNSHEANPAPGAHQPGRIRMTHISKQSWKQKWQACVDHFTKEDTVEYYRSGFSPNAETRVES